MGSVVKTTFDCCSWICAGVNVIGADTSRIRFNKSYTKETGNEPDHTEWAKKGCDFMTVIRYFPFSSGILFSCTQIERHKNLKTYKH